MSVDLVVPIKLIDYLLNYGILSIVNQREINMFKSVLRVFYRPKRGRPYRSELRNFLMILIKGRGKNKTTS